MSPGGGLKDQENLKTKVSLGGQSPWLRTTRATGHECLVSSRNSQEDSMVGVNQWCQDSKSGPENWALDVHGRRNKFVLSMMENPMRTFGKGADTVRRIKNKISSPI